MSGCCSNIVPSEGLKMGSSAPDFNLPNVDDKMVSLEDYRGKVKALAIVFWCNHCPYVIKSEDKMIVLGNEYLNKEVGFVMISANDKINYPQDAPARMKERAEAKAYPFPYLFNEDQQVAKAYGAQVTPHVFLFDGEMKLIYRGAIDDNMNGDKSETTTYLKDAIDAILADSAGKIEQTDTKPIGCSVKWK
ncbi:MAG: thioredoxin family protein [Calditrichaeota bacterium]|nr:thioredoxin family protein [Calditrichota bacterium]